MWVERAPVRVPPEAFGAQLSCDVMHGSHPSGVLPPVPKWFVAIVSETQRQTAILVGDGKTMLLADGEHPESLREALDVFGGSVCQLEKTL